MKKLIYISGKITGAPINEVRAKFEAAAQLLDSIGYIPVSPFNNGISPDAPWIDQMISDLRIINRSDGIYMLTDWSDSIGARIEHAVATMLFESDNILYQNEK